MAPVALIAADKTHIIDLSQSGPPMPPVIRSAEDLGLPSAGVFRLLPAGAVAGWDLHPLESAALSRRTPKAGFNRLLRKRFDDDAAHRVEA
jgi:hypothetical protein